MKAPAMTNPSTQFKENFGAFVANMGANGPVALENQRANEKFLETSEFVREIPGIFDILEGSNAVIVGGSPTVADKVEQIKVAQEQEIPVFACNGVGKWMDEQGLERPDYVCLLDPRPRVIRYLQDAPPPKQGVIVAMSVHPSILEWLEKNKMPTTVYRAMEDEDKPVISGGSTVMTRMMVVMSCLGYHHIHVIGASSDFAEDGTNHVYAHPSPDKRVQVAAATGYPYRWTTPNLAAQGWEFPQVVMILNRLRGNVIYLHERDCLTSDYLDACSKGLLKFPVNGADSAKSEHMDFTTIQNLGETV